MVKRSINNQANTGRRGRPVPVPVHASVTHFDGGAVKLEIVIDPESAARLADQLVNALMRNNRRRVRKTPQSAVF